MDSSPAQSFSLDLVLSAPLGAADPIRIDPASVFISIYGRRDPVSGVISVPEPSAFASLLLMLVLTFGGVHALPDTVFSVIPRLRRSH